LNQYLLPGGGLLLLLVPGPTLPSLDGLRDIVPLLMPVVVPDFILLDLVDFMCVLVPPLMPGAGCVCADAIVVAPTSDAATRTDIISLDRMKDILLG
jgi:hypothetical protein